MITVDLRGLEGKAPFEKLRDTMRPFCGKEVEAEILVDDEQTIGKIRQFVAMSGCTSDVADGGGFWTIRISGDACHCR